MGAGARRKPAKPTSGDGNLSEEETQKFKQVQQDLVAAAAAPNPETVAEADPGLKEAGAGSDISMLTEEEQDVLKKTFAEHEDEAGGAIYRPKDASLEDLLSLSHSQNDNNGDGEA